MTAPARPSRFEDVIIPLDVNFNPFDIDLTFAHDIQAAFWHYGLNDATVRVLFDLGLSDIASLRAINGDSEMWAEIRTKVITQLGAVLWV